MNEDDVFFVWFPLCKSMLCAGGNINYKTGHAIFEATHGTAPKYANLDQVRARSTGGLNPDIGLAQFICLCLVTQLTL